MIFVLATLAWAQECPPPEELELCCNPPPHAECAFQAVPSEDTALAGAGVAAWLTDGESGFNWRARSRQHWNTVNLSEPDPINSGAYLEPDFLRFVTDTTNATGSLRAGGGGSGFSAETSCGILTSGGIGCWGAPVELVSGRPTGTNFTNGELAVNNYVGTSTNLPIWVAIDDSGCVSTWGNVSGGGNMFNTNKPSTCGWDTVGIGQGAFGCVADTAGTGISCWKSGTGAMVVADNAPTTGTYKQISLGRYFASAVTTAGTLTLWGDTQVTDLIAEWTAAGITKPIQEAYVYGETGMAQLLVFHTDHTITLVKDPDTASSVNIIKTAPCVDPPPGGTCAGTAWNVWTSAIKFRTSPQINHNNLPRICGVVEQDPDSQFNPGSVICWGATYSAATFAPIVVDDSCEDAWWLD